jgi:hypothetical protein
MADHRPNRGPQDSSRINTEKDYELRHWSEKWSVSGERVKAAVVKVGNSVDAVAEELRKQP